MPLPFFFQALLLGFQHTFEPDHLAAVSVLVISCPCAMGLAVPTAQVVAAGALLKRGLLVKDGSALERLAEVDIALFDKTGTLTLGEPRPDLGGLDAEAKRVALGLAQASRHPLSQGLAAALRAEGVKAAPIESLSEASGQGIAGMWNGQAVALTRPEHDNAQLATQLMIGEEVHLLTFHDPLRGDAAEALGVLRASGIEATAKALSARWPGYLGSRRRRRPARRTSSPRSTRFAMPDTARLWWGTG